MAVPDITGQLAQYMLSSRQQDLPSGVAEAGKHRILDSLGAIVSGARLRPGEMAIRYVRPQGGLPEASVLTTDVKTSAVNAALANGMFGHADETDDFEPVTKAHPGCSVVPAALAMAEREGSSGEELLRAVVLGYDLCCRFILALGPDLMRGGHRSAEGTSSTMGSTAAAASLAKLDQTGMRYALSYAAHRSRVSGAGFGTWSMWRRPSTSRAWEPATESQPPPWCKWVLRGFGTYSMVSKTCWKPYPLRQIPGKCWMRWEPASS